MFYVKTARDVVTVLLIFAKYLSLYLHIFTCTYRGTHTQAHICTIRTQEEWRQPGTGAWYRSLVERGGIKALLETLHTQKKNRNKNVSKKSIFTNLEKRFVSRNTRGI